MIALLLACAHAAAPAVPAPPPAPVSPALPPVEVPVPASAYAAWLRSQGIDRADFHEETRWRSGSWTFFTLDGPFPDHPAAVSASGVVAREAPGGWYALLGLPLAEAAPRAAWLLGNPIPLSPADPVVPGAHVSDPAVESPAPDTRVLTMWVAWPPQVQEPYRVRITAKADGTALIEETYWSDVK